MKTWYILGRGLNLFQNVYIIGSDILREPGYQNWNLHIFQHFLHKIALVLSLQIKKNYKLFQKSICLHKILLKESFW